MRPLENLTAGPRAQETSGQRSVKEALSGGCMDVRGPSGPRHQVLQVDRHETDHEVKQGTVQVSVKVGCLLPSNL